MASPSEIAGGRRRSSRVQVEKVVPKWIPLEPPLPTPVDLAEIHHRIALGENRRGSIQLAPPPLGEILLQPSEGQVEWRGGLSASTHGPPPQLSRPSVVHSLDVTSATGFRTSGPQVLASFRPAIRSRRYPASNVPGHDFQVPWQQYPGNPLDQSGSFQDNPAQPRASGFKNYRPYDYPEPWRPSLGVDSLQRFVSTGVPPQLLPKDGFPNRQRLSATEASGSQKLSEASIARSAFQENDSLAALCAPRSGVESKRFSSNDQDVAWAGEADVLDAASTGEAAVMVDRMGEPGAHLLGQTRYVAGYEELLPDGSPSTVSALGSRQQEEMFYNSEALAYMTPLSDNTVHSGPPLVASQRLGYWGESALEETDLDMPVTIDSDPRSNSGHQNGTQNSIRTHPWPSAEDGQADHEFRHFAMHAISNENAQQVECETFDGHPDDIQQGRGDEDAPISFGKRLSDPYALKDLSRWRPKDYDDYPELKRIQTEYGEMLGKPSGKALAPILKARQRIRMAESHHEERKQQKEIDVVERLSNFFMRLLRRKSASTAGYGNSGPWADHLRQIEGQFGSAVMLAFAFLQWAFVFNCFLSVLWLIMIIIPFCIRPPKSFSWRLFSHAGLWGLLQTNGVDLTFMLYGGYSYIEGEKYGMAELYAITILLMLVASFLAVSSRMIQNLQTGRLESAYKITTAYPFSTIAFTSWDFHITSHDSATALRRTIRMEMRQMLADVKDPPIEGFVRNIFLTRQRYLALLVVWPLVHATSVGFTILLAVKDWGINKKLGTNLAQSAILATVHIAGSFLTKYLVRLEDWRPLTAEHVLGFKLFALRMGYLVALFSRLFIMLNNAQRHFEGTSPYATCGSDKSCAFSGYVCCTSTNTTLSWGNVINGNILTKMDIITKKTVPLQQCVAEQVGKCVPLCVENAVGKQLLRLVFTSALIQNGVRLSRNYFKVYVLKLNVVIDIEDIALGVVYMQALVWVGSCFAPVAPFLALLNVVVTFYCEKMIMMSTCDSSGRQYSVSRSSNAIYGLLTVTLFGCTFAVAAVLWNRSGPCGPVPTHSLSEAFDIPLQRLPKALGLLLRWATSGFLWGSILCLAMVVYFLQRVKLRRASQSLWVTQQELDAQYEKYSALVLHKVSYSL